jgi:uncharacterized DUF497 family protein
LVSDTFSAYKTFLGFLFTEGKKVVGQTLKKKEEMRIQIKDVILTKKVERHIEKHEVTREEVLNVLNGFKYVKRKGKRFLFYGKTKVGRHLTILVDKGKNGEYYLITARESTKSEKVLYKKKAK